MLIKNGTSRHRKMKLNPFSFQFVDAVRRYLTSQNLSLRNKQILAAVSGGVDSSVLLDVLYHLSEMEEFSLYACHVNHGLRGEESQQDETFVIQRTRDYNIPLTVRRFEQDDIQAVQSGNVEEEARILRYKLLTNTAEELNFDAIATGHTKSDQAETVLHRLMRSSGLSGLAGIWPVCTMDGQTVMRPFLCHPRAAVLAYAEQNKIPFRQDSMNEDEQFTRVSIRKHLIPYLQSNYNPNVEDSLFHLASICKDEEDYWDVHLNHLTKRIGDGTQEAPANRLHFQSLTKAEQRRYLRRWLQSFQVDPSYAVIERMVDMLNREKPQEEFPINETFYLFRRYDQFYISPKEPSKSIDGIVEIRIPGKTVSPEFHVAVETEILPGNVIPLENDNRFRIRIDYEKVKHGLYIRSRREGDAIQPLGMSGSKKLKKILQERKATKEERETMPLLCHGNEIVWVPGYCESDRHKITEKTRQILQIILKPF